MDVVCKQCENFDVPNCHLGKLGFGLCKASNFPGHTYSASRPHECEKFKPATDETLRANAEAAK